MTFDARKRRQRAKQLPHVFLSAVRGLCFVGGDDPGEAPHVGARCERRKRGYADRSLRRKCPTTQAKKRTLLQGAVGLVGGVEARAHALSEHEDERHGSLIVARLHDDSDESTREHVGRERLLPRVGHEIKRGKRDGSRRCASDGAREALHGRSAKSWAGGAGVFFSLAGSVGRIHRSLFPGSGDGSTSLGPVGGFVEATHRSGENASEKACAGGAA